MRLCILSDNHGLTPNIEDCDLILHAGDFTHSGKNSQRGLIEWNRVILPWLKRAAKKTAVVAIPGNHDFCFVDYPHLIAEAAEYNIYILNHSSMQIGNLNIFGTPIQPIFHNWAFNRGDFVREAYFNQISPVDILLTHCPPEGILDWVPTNDLSGRMMRAGDRILAKYLPQIQPRLHCFGHLHSNYGVHVGEHTVSVASSLVDENYQLIREPIYLEFE